MREVSDIIQGLISPLIGRAEAVDVIEIASKIADVRPDLAPAAIRDAVALTALSLGLSCFWSGLAPRHEGGHERLLNAPIAA